MADTKTWWLDADNAIPKTGMLPAKANTITEGGRIAWSDGSGYAIPSSATTASSKAWGIYLNHVDNSTGTTVPGNSGLNNGVPTGVPYQQGYALCLGDGSVTAANVGQYVYLVSDSGTGKPTVGLSDNGGTRPLVGFVSPYVRTSSDVDPSAIVVAIGFARPDALDPELAGSSAAFTSRNVATNLPGTFTVTSGVLLADANGALGAQDGVTNAVGDVILFPAGTVGSGTVTAANSGPWLLTAIGGASAKFAATRPDWWVNGNNVVPGVKVRIGGEGTLWAGTEWKTFAAATVVIGTGDPALYPASVTQQVTLSSSTATITNVPIRLAAKTGVFCNLATAGGTQTSTVAYGPIVAPTPGALGTASLVIDAIASGQTKNGTADTSVVNVTIVQ